MCKQVRVKAGKNKCYEHVPTSFKVIKLLYCGSNKLQQLELNHSTSLIWHFQTEKKKRIYQLTFIYKLVKV